MSQIAELKGTRNTYIAIGIRHKETFFHLEASKNNEFIFYDNFEIIVKDSMEYPEPPQQPTYSEDQLAGESFKQPEYAFIIDNEHTQIHLTKNVDRMVLEIKSRENGSFSWINVSDEYAKYLYNTIKTELTANGDHPVIISSEQTVLKPLSCWVTYDCIKTLYRGGTM